jgi:hypothetical protein
MNKKQYPVAAKAGYGNKRSNRRILHTLLKDLEDFGHIQKVGFTTTEDLLHLWMWLTITASVRV